jgi:hypothetical protein
MPQYVKNAVVINPETNTPYSAREIAGLGVEEIERINGVSFSTAYKTRKAAMAEVMSNGASTSLAEGILDILKNGPVKEIDELRLALGFKGRHANNHDVTAAVWSLQKRDLVTFYERKNGHNSVLSQMKLTRRGLQEMGLAPVKDSANPDAVKSSKELKRPSPVGKDMTEAKHHHWIAKGSEIEIENGAPKTEPEVIATPAYKPEDVKLPKEPNQNEKPERSIDDDLALVMRNFKLIPQILEKRTSSTKLEAAAELLIDAGQEEMAQDLMGKATLSPLEKEIADYVQRVSALCRLRAR